MKDWNNIPMAVRRRLLAAGAAAALCPAAVLAAAPEPAQDWDVIVIGTGMAGLTAAVSAARPAPRAFCFWKRVRSSGGIRFRRRGPSP